MTRPKYDKHFEADPRACGDPFPEFMEVLEQLGRDGPKRILDLGCGQGRDALHAAEQGHSVVAVDISSIGIRQLSEVAAAKGLEVQAVVADILEYEPEGSFDVVLLDRVLHMLPGHAEVRAVVKKSARAVVTGGEVLIADVPSNETVVEAFFRKRAREWDLTKPKKGFLFARKKC